MKKALHVAILIAVILLAVLLRDTTAMAHPKNHVETCEGNHQ